MKTSKRADPQTGEEERAARLANGLQSGDGWHLEWAESVFRPGFRFQYVAKEGVFEPWAGLDDVLVERGYRSRADLAVSRNLNSADVSRPRSNEQPEEVAF